MSTHPAGHPNKGNQVEMKKITVHNKDSLKGLHSTAFLDPTERPAANGGVPLTFHSQPSKPLHSQYPAATNAIVGSFNNTLAEYKYEESPHAFAEVQVKIIPTKYALPRRHMHVKPSAKAAAIDSRIERMAEAYASRSGLSTADYAHPSLLSPDPIITVGRIVADTDAKFSEKSIMLEASRSIGSGVRIPLDLTDCPSFGLFSGQIVQVEGSNPDGKSLRVKRFLQSAKMISSHAPVPPDCQSKKPMGVLVVSGPYCLDDSLDFAPLERILKLAEEKRPNLLLLLGPFIDAEHSLIKLGERISCTPEDLFRDEILARLLQFCNRNSFTKVHLVPSLFDIGHDNVFPQCAFHPPMVPPDHGILSKQVAFLPNPAWFTLNEIVVAISTNDVLLSLGTDEIVRTPPGEPVDRIGRLCSYVVEQNCLYPSSPPIDGANVDYGMLEQLEMPILPNLLIMPSSLRHFAKSVIRDDDCNILVINPGQLCKKQALGTAAFVSISPTTETGFNISKQCRVDFLQF